MAQTVTGNVTAAFCRRVSGWKPLPHMDCLALSRRWEAERLKWSKS